ncbi:MULTISPECIES: transporter substrate-binding protein [Thioclava]|uniref:transporter substrate-binding protein n=1 Tax=Thioclava TaxID=285107 RepID=UPI00099809FB|nr:MULTISPECIES: transporter substrate-binding protein [Thioclava]MAQ35690.1 ABC transporter substrate-binding protein [Thioclava sp.]MPQ94939.1 transporter substrate-binding protein [Thioclava sp. JE_KL1]OOY15358.1 ABC transporter substrate-binding protein [Thioclava sp. DLFJ4-1]|tara:strand:+ start:2867 stop:4117 length:1251 start_codon:yes stop_codon:yes gene_type:complete
MKTNRRNFLKHTTAFGAAAALGPSMIASPARASGEIEVGVLFSLTGGLSIIEKSLADATMMAIDEINAAGGVNGMMIKPILEDGASDPKTYNEKASKLVIRDRLQTVFGSYTSASRKAVLPVFEKRNSLYFYPTYYEGFECSKNVVYTGAVPNQQLSNFIPWITNTLGKKKFFIVGSNYIYPREMAKVSKILIEQNGGEWVADEYLELGHSEWGAMVSKIKESGCDVVLSNVVGDSVVAFYREFKNQGLTHDKLPICATVTSEIEIAAMGPEFAEGSYTSFPYFQAIDTDRNRDFIERYRKYVNDPKAVTHHALESSYFQVYLWKQAVEKAGDISADAVREGIKGQVFEAPNGTVTVDPENLHTYLTPRIAQWGADGQGTIVNAYDAPTKPLPYVAYGETAENLFCTGAGLDTTKL